MLHVPDLSQVLAAPDASLQPRPVVPLDAQENAVGVGVECVRAPRVRVRLQRALCSDCGGNRLRLRRWIRDCS